MNKKDITLAIAFILFALIMILLSSCGSNYHIRRAQHHIKKAEQKGAVWSRDTFFTKMKFKVPGIDVKFTPKILTTDKPMIFVKDSVRTEVLIVKGNNGVDTVYVSTDCPDQEIEREVPVTINNELKAGKSFWYYLQWIGLAFVVGCITGFLIRAGSKLNLNILTKEKPP